MYLNQDKDLYKDYLSESLFYNPWDKTIEKNLNEELGLNTDNFKTFFVVINLSDEAISIDPFLKNLFSDYKPQTNIVPTQLKEFADNQDTSRIDSLDFHNYTLHLIYCNKTMNGSCSGRFLALYCVS